MDEDPKGFMGKWQAHSPQQPIIFPHEAGRIIHIIQKKASCSASIRSWLIHSFNTSSSFSQTNDICDALSGIQLSNGEVEIIQNSFVTNNQVSWANNIVNILDNEWILSHR